MKDKTEAKIFWSASTEQMVEDCACSIASVLPAAKGRKVAPLWERPPNLYREMLPEGHTLVFNPFGPAGVVALNAAALAELEVFRVAQPIESDTARQLAALGLLQSQGAIQGPPQVEPDLLTAWLHVTNACNLRCTYCYVNKTDEAMDEATGRSAIDAIFRSARLHHFKGVKLKYAGGEATLNFELVRTLHRYAKSLAVEYGLEFQDAVLSNGVALSNTMLDFIRDNGINLMISLDGVGAAHDAQRVFSNGKGSFKIVAWSINRALARGVRPHLSITVTGNSVDGVAQAVTFALDRDLRFNLNFYRENDYSKSQADLQAEDERLIAAMKAAFKVIEERLPQQSLISALVDRSNFGGSHTRTCGAGHNYMVVDHNGGMTRCQMEIDKPVTTIHAADPLLALQTVSSGFQNVAVDDKEGCRTCEWRYWCTGGCPLLTRRVTGRSDVRSPYCNVYKALYPELLRLEGLRLVKWREENRLSF